MKGIAWVLIRFHAMRVFFVGSAAFLFHRPPIRYDFAILALPFSTGRDRRSTRNLALLGQAVDFRRTVAFRWRSYGFCVRTDSARLRRSRPSDPGPNIASMCPISGRFW